MIIQVTLPDKKRRDKASTEFGEALAVYLGTPITGGCLDSVLGVWIVSVSFWMMSKDVWEMSRGV